MLKLEKLSKFYYKSGNVGIGLKDVDLELDMGEFVVVTGESGSGKTTLLNVISGIDTYEEGELYLNGEETSGFSSKQWENYRNKNVAFIFQKYNLIDSYTVLQNVEIALILSNYDKENRRKRALELIERVGLLSHKNQKASKLSGGQKQRVVIARALAKDTPIIVADEPTGNLDSKSSETVIKLLREISKDKLVLIVTHNPDEVLDYASRMIRIFDGKVVNDKYLNSPVKTTNYELDLDLKQNKFSFGSILKIARQNILSIPKKTILSLFALSLFTFAFFCVYTLLFVDTSLEESLAFTPINFMSEKNRIIVIKDDRSAFTQNEIDEISKMNGILETVEESEVLDYNFSLMGDDEISIYLTAKPLKLWGGKDKISDGSMPSNKNEILLPAGYSYFFDIGDELKTEFSSPLKVSGFYKSSESYVESVFVKGEFFEELATHFKENKISLQSKGTLNLGDSTFPNMYVMYEDTFNGYLHPSSFNTFRYYMFKYCITENNLTQETCNSYYKDNTSIELNGKTIDIMFESNEISNLINDVYELNNNGGTPIKPEENNMFFFLPMDVYKNAFLTDEIVQISLFADTSIDARQLTKNLNKNDFIAFTPADVTTPDMAVFIFITKLIFAIFYSLLLIFVFFVTYLIMRNVLNSRKPDYAILRSIGSNKAINRKIIFAEILILTLVSFLICSIPVIILANIFKQNEVLAPAKYISPLDYFIITLIMCLFALMLSNSFNKRIFKNSIDSTLREF